MVFRVIYFSLQISGCCRSGIQTLSLFLLWKELDLCHLEVSLGKFLLPFFKLCAVLGNILFPFFKIYAVLSVYMRISELTIKSYFLHFLFFPSSLSSLIPPLLPLSIHPLSHSWLFISFSLVLLYFLFFSFGKESDCNMESSSYNTAPTANALQ